MGKRRSIKGLLAVLSAVLAPVVSAQCPGSDDAFEDNDDCASAAPLTVGLYTGLYTESPLGDQDYFAFEIPSNESATIDLTFDHALGNIDVIIWSEACAQILAISSSGTDNEFVEVVNGSSEPMGIVMQVFVTSTTATDCNTYDLQIATMADSCAGTVDDGMEDNDDCAAAVPLQPGTYSDLVVTQTDLDFYALQVAGGEQVVIDCTHDHAQGDINLFLFDANGPCGGGFTVDAMAYAISQTDDESLVWANDTGAAVDLVLEVSLSQTVPTGCNTYDLGVSFESDACIQPDDALEPNDSCATAFPFGMGAASDLFVSVNDRDFYSVTVPDGEVLGVDCNYEWIETALYVVLWDSSEPCDGGPFSGGLLLSSTPIDNERLFWRNDTGAAAQVIVEVGVAFDANGSCNAYDLAIQTFPDPCPGGLGELLCLGLPNSTGAGSTLCTTGSDLVDDNDLTLSVSGLPADSMGYFIVARAPVLPLVGAGGSAGELCVASPWVGRQTPILQSGAGGSVSLPVDLALTPQPDGPVAIVAGESWCWQYWHRDVGSGGSATSNFSSARLVKFD